MGGGEKRYGERCAGRCGEVYLGVGRLRVNLGRGVGYGEVWGDEVCESVLG